MKNYLLRICVVGLCLQVPAVFSLPSLESYGAQELSSKMRVSPNGDIIAYRHTSSDEDDHLVVYSIKDNKTLAALNVEEVDPKQHYFVNNNYLVLMGSEHVDSPYYTLNYDVSTAFSFDYSNGNVSQLIQLGEKLFGSKIVTPVQTGVGRVAGQSKDGNVLYLPAYVNEKLELDSVYSLLKVNINGKSRPRIVRRGTGNTRAYFLDDNGEVLAREALNDNSNEHRIEIPNGRSWKTIYSYKSKIKSHDFIGLTNDYKQLIFFWEEGGRGKYRQLSLSDGTIGPIADFKFNKSIYSLIQDRYGVIAGVEFSGFSPTYKMLDSNLDTRIQKIVSLFKENSVYITDWSEGWKDIVVRVEGPHYTGDYFLFSEGQDRPRFLLSSRDDIKSEDINPIGQITVKARDGLNIPTLLTLPMSKKDNLKNMPTVLLPHGGPASQDKVGFDYMAQAFASRGFLVVQPQYRGSIGFGVDHYTAGWGEWGRKMQDDLSDTVDAMVKRGYSDPKRVCIVGASYGGYAALAGAAFTPELYRCAVSLAGVSHLPKMLDADKSRYGKDSWILDFWNRSILAGEYDRASLKVLSPYYSADKIRVPVLLLHGEDDKIVEYEQSKLMYKAIKKAKGDVQLIKLKNDDHYLLDAVTRIQALKAMVTFVEEQIGGDQASVQ